VRLVFLGTPEAAVPPLRALVANGHEVALVVSRADKRRGRGIELTPSPAKAAALELGLPVTSKVDDVIDTGADLGVVVAFGQIIKPHVLAAVPMVNLHFSLLPRWRGAAPVERAILAGDTSTGVCLMAIDEGLDTGPVYGCDGVEIGPEETAAELRARLADLGAALLVGALRSGLGEATPQEGPATYADKIQPADLFLDWSRPAAELHRVVRLGRAWTTWRGRRLIVLSARLVPGAPLDAAAGPPGHLQGDVVATGAGGLRLIAVQPEGRGPLAAVDWLRGARPQPDEVLGL
jgi:methionyl-tRNA formyltransferase